MADHYNQHHINALAKQLLTQTVSVMVGLSDSQKFTCTMQDIERNHMRHQHVYSALLVDGYISTQGTLPFLITDKVFDEVEPLMWGGAARCGSPREPLAVWLSNGILKSIVIALRDGTARLVTGSADGSRGVLHNVAGVGGFSDYFARELSVLAQKHTELGRVAADGLRMSGAVGSGAELSDLFDGTVEDRRAELARAKRELDALVCFESAVVVAGGWDMFVVRARRDFDAAQEACGCGNGSSCEKCR
jgi:hypothetical protein